MIGRRLGHYEIRAELGHGGMGHVFLATDLKLGRQVALKVLPEEFAVQPDRLARFRREARTIAALNHPNIVTLYSEEESDGVTFLTMEFVDGESLDKAIPPDGMPLERLLELAIPLADALSAAEEQGITHRDIKPSNIMVSRQGVIKMLDFGLAKLLGAAAPIEGQDATTELLTRQGRILGTRPYMSPEHLHGREIDHRSDIFSLGIVLHEMATGRRPFAGDTPAELISAIMRDEPSSISELRPELPPHLGRIIARCLEKDPERRYQTARDLRHDLEALRLESATAGEARRSASAWAPRGRRAASGAGRGLQLARPAIVALAALAVVIAAVWVRGRGQERVETAGRVTLDLGVLPFDNRLTDPRDDYLAEGISAALVTRLGELQGVRVAAREQAWELADEGLSAAEIARRMSLSHVLEGEISESEGRLEVVPRLVDGGSGIVVWSRAVSGERGDLFDLQRRLVAELTEVLAIPLSRRERRRLAQDPTGSRQAYEYYLKGLQRLRDREARPEFAVESFRQALRIDAGFTLAHAGLSEALGQVYARDRDPSVLAEAESAAHRAVELDPGLPAAHMARARLFRMTGRLDASIADLEEILASHPRPSKAYRELAFTYSYAGDLERALVCLQTAVTLDPDDWSAWNSLGALELRMGDYDGARRSFERAAGLTPKGISWPQQNLATVALYEGDFEGAVAAYEKIGGGSQDVDLVSNIGTAYFFLGDLERAEELYRLAVELNPQDDVSHRNLGDVYLRLGRRELARSEFRLALELVEERLADSPGRLGLRLARALYSAKAGECDLAVPAAEELATSVESDAAALHKIAQTFALCSEGSQAIEALRRGVELGLSPRLVLEEDEFAGVRDDPAFEALVAESGGSSDD